jgi:NADPH:quinone reductase-like Zn-dependent oxidoreductase
VPVRWQDPGTSCLATISQSLRDKSHSPIEAPDNYLSNLQFLVVWPVGAVSYAMKAVRFYGSRGSERVVLEEIPTPEIGAGQVLIRVHATAVTPGELEWYPTLHTPKGDPRSQQILSHEFSGVIEEVAADITGLEKGDAVYGMNNWFMDGAAAEYCISTPTEIAPKPKALDHVHTAAVPISGLTAWQALFEHGKLEAGQKVLIHGGAGGVGTFAIQLAAWKGASTTKNQDSKRWCTMPTWSWILSAATR